jgi:hypothetical protein
VTIYGAVNKYFDTSRFALPALGTFGTAGRNILTGWLRESGYLDLQVVSHNRV